MGGQVERLVPFAHQAEAAAVIRRSIGQAFPLIVQTVPEYAHDCLGVFYGSAVLKGTAQNAGHEVKLKAAYLPKVFHVIHKGAPARLVLPVIPFKGIIVRRYKHGHGAAALDELYFLTCKFRKPGLHVPVIFVVERG